MERKKVWIAIICISIYFVGVLPHQFDVDRSLQAFALLVIAQILWVGRILPLGYASLIIMLLIAIHILPFHLVIGYFGESNVWLLFATFILAAAFFESGLAMRISLKILRYSGGGSRRLILMSFGVMVILAFLIPTNLGRASLIGTLFLGMIKHLENIGKVDNLAKSLFIGLNYVVVITGALVVTASNSGIYVFGMMNEVSVVGFNYLFWIILFAPPILVFIFLLWLLLLWKFPAETIEKKKVLDYIDGQIGQLGKISTSEIKMTIIILLTVVMWILEPAHHLPIQLIALLGALTTMLPIFGIWEWEQARTKIDWDMLIFFAATLVVSRMLIDTGALESFATVVVDHIQVVKNSFFIILVLGLLTTILRLVFVNVLGYLTIMIPLAIIIGQQIPYFSPVILCMVVFLLGMPGFFLVSQSAVNLLSFNYGYYQEKDLWKIGIMASTLWLIIVLLFLYGYWVFFTLE